MLVALSSFLDIRRQDNEKLASGMVILAGILWESMGIFVRKFEIWFFKYSACILPVYCRS